MFWRSVYTMENTVGNFHDIYQEVECDYDYIPHAIEYIKGKFKFRNHVWFDYHVRLYY